MDFREALLALSRANYAEKGVDLSHEKVVMMEEKEGRGGGMR